MSLTNQAPSFYIETLGCPKNKVDSRKMQISLIDGGYSPVNKPENADIILINSCSFIQEAQQETIDTIFQALDLKKQSGQVVGVVGCFAERFNSAIQQDIPELDFTIGTGKYAEVADILTKELKFDVSPGSNSVHNTLHDQAQDTIHSYFRIGTGCSRKCAFCILPKIRGPWTPYSLEDFKTQLDHDVRLRSGETPLREIVLVSQDTVAIEPDTLRTMLDYLSAIEDIEWIRLQYLFPDRQLLGLLDLFDEYPKLVSYLDMPMQHTSPEMLKKMKRPSDTELFKEIMSKARSLRPELELRTSFILGFPGETYEDTNFLRSSIEELKIDKLALFRYSHESGTYAGDHLDDHVSEEDKAQRMNEVRDFHLQTRNSWRAALAGNNEKVIVETVHKNEIIARRQYDAPEIDEQVYLPYNKSIEVGDLISISLDTPMEYDWLGSYN